jgi:hypothetical protein
MKTKANGRNAVKRISSHPDQGVTVTLRPAIPISLRETPNAVKLRFLSVPTLKNTSNLVGE